jgi:hypothetical protein
MTNQLKPILFLLIVLCAFSSKAFTDEDESRIHNFLIDFHTSENDSVKIQFFYDYRFHDIVAENGDTITSLLYELFNRSKKEEEKNIFHMSVGAICSWYAVNR